MAEWSNALDLSSSSFGSAGSNPAGDTTFKKSHSKHLYCFFDLTITNDFCIHTYTPIPPWSSGQDSRLSRVRPGFDSLWGSFWSHSLVVMTCDFESHIPSSNLGGTYYKSSFSNLITILKHSESYFFLFRWCSWLSRMPNTHKVTSSNLVRNYFL